MNLTFTISEGPKYKIKNIDFVGNKQVGDGKLRKQMKDTKAMSWLSFITQKGTYKEDKYAEDAEKVVGYYRDNGYLRVRVDNPEVRTLENSKDGKTRYVELRIPVSEGPRYKVGDVKVVDNKVVKAEALVQVFALKPGDYYSEKRVRKGMEKAREIYGSIGYFEFTAFPDFAFRDLPKDAQPRSMEEAQRATAVAEAGKPGPAIVDVTMHMQEGEQYFVNRITFLGNSTTHDNVIRREMQLVESGVFNTEALKQSVKHLNQLGYFKALEGNENVQVDKTPGEKNKVDIALKLEEQNRNQLTFGAGVSQFEGAFAQFAFQTSNFLGKGETLSMSVLAGRRYKDYQLSFSEPYLFDRPITGGINVFNRHDQLHRRVHAGVDGRQRPDRLPPGQLHARLHVVQLRAGRDQQPEPGLHGSRARQHATRSWPTRCSSARTASGPSARSRRASCTTRSTTRSSRPPGGASRSASTSPASAATPASTSRASRPSTTSSRHASCRPASGPSSSSSRRGSDSLFVPIFERLVQGGEYSRPRLRHPHHRPARQHHGAGHRRQQEPAVQRRVLYQIAGPVRVLAFFDAGQVRQTGRSSGRTRSSPRRAPRSGSSCRCSTCPSA